ncbi:MAG TPA: GNAT family N-acetyltransferase [Patescibacteria group bacterium]|nr:GNAT family N-acetyltransferase [Patescibacteria group bacterium]
MEVVTIRSFTLTDIEFAYESVIIEKWGNTKKDIERMLDYDPYGCFIVDVNKKPVGHIFSVSYGKLGWIGLLIVRAEHRGMGLGTLLMKKAMNHLAVCGVETMNLEARPAAVQLYRELGFVDQYGSLRFAGNNRNLGSEHNSTVKLLEERMMDEVAKFDARYFGGNRMKVLMQLRCDHPKLCFASFTGSRLAGYVMCRNTEKGYRIGPWVCDAENPRAAEELLTKCLKTLGEDVEIQVGVPVVNKTAVQILRKFRFKQYARSMRMRFGKVLETECINGIFAVGGPEKG